MDIKTFIDFVRNDYGTDKFIPLHAPVFKGNEKKYLNECVDSTFVSSVGKYVDRFEEQIEKFTGAAKAVAVVNGTNGLMVALRLAGVQSGDEVITQSLTFIATCNSIKYLNAEPSFVDVDKDTLGLSPSSLNDFLTRYCEKSKEGTFNKSTGRRVAACVPMHTFGHPARIDDIVAICDEWGIPVVEDAAESLGSFVGSEHTGLKGLLGVISFNGNKTITTGGGGVLITKDAELGKKAKYLTTTAKRPHPYEFFHDELGYNFRMPNINAALGCAQMEQLSILLERKRARASRYNDFFLNINSIDFVNERARTTSNYWLNSVILASREDRDCFLKETNDAGVMTRPIWTLMNKLPMYKNCFAPSLEISQWLEDRVVNIPSGEGL